MDWDAFFTVHRDLPREGPGLPEDVHWALSQITPPARVLDAACGPGGDTATLAEALPRAQIEAVEKVDHFVDATRARVQQFGPRVSVQVRDMLAPSVAPFDFIWCAGAVYFCGIEQALTAWRAMLVPGGAVAFSEPVLPDNPGPGALKFWEGEGQVSTREEVLAQVEQAGFRVRATRPVVGAAWEVYYTAMQDRIDALRAAGVTEAVEQACVEAETEIANWRAASDEVIYLLILAEPEDSGAV